MKINDLLNIMQQLNNSLFATEQGKRHDHLALYT